MLIIIAMFTLFQSLIRSLCHQLALVVGLSLTAGTLVSGSGLAQTRGTVSRTAEAVNACPEPALSRVSRHRVAKGDTLESIAQQYNLIPDTIQGFNPSLQSGNVVVGQELMIPPFNGIRVTVPQGQTWQDVAQAYNRRADVLFEVNGCVSTVPGEIFVPGVNWFPGVQTVSTPASENPANQVLLGGYPLPSRTDVIVNYGWQPTPNQDRLVFNTGIALAAEETTPVLAVGAGTVAFAGNDREYGNLVVVNHERGLQTRYANLSTVEVEVGQSVQQGTFLGQVGPGEGEASFLFFEVRLNSERGWVAQDPQDHVPSLALR
jgi:murein DD-endopeptidase MepM/ murein hydrolase activator NlpD